MKPLNDISGVHWAALAALEGVGPARLQRFAELGDPVETWSRIVSGSLRDFRDFADRWKEQARKSPPELMTERLERLEVAVLSVQQIPERLRNSVDTPSVLFVQGGLANEFPTPETPTVAIVGTRKATPYGLGIAEALGAELSEAGVSVVSGLALGIDAAAHRGALCGHAAPLAILGAGHHRPCPARNRAIASEVRDRGAIWSEIPPGTSSAPWRYPARNRIIAAVADVVVVIESAPAGGSMLTVSEALQRGVEVMAVPGPLNRRASAGCLELLRDGAHMCTGAADVLSLLGLVAPETSDTKSLSPDPLSTGTHSAEDALSTDARLLLDQLMEAPLAFDSAMSATGMDFARIAAAAGELERARIARNRDGWIEATR